MAADPYEYPTLETERRGSPISIMTLIGVLFALFMVWQVMNTLGDADEQIERLTIHEGDEIEYHYTARLPDGRVLETTRESVARTANATHDFTMQPTFSYVPQRATVDPDEPGLKWGAQADRAVVGAHVGQTVTFTAPGAEWEPLTPNSPGIPRELLPQFFQRTVFLQEPAAATAEGNPGSQRFDLDSVNEQIGPLSDGHVFNAGSAFQAWDIIIEDVNFENRSLTFTHTVQDGQTFDVPEMGGQVTVFLRDNERSLVFRLDIPEGTVFTVRQGDALNQAGFTPGSYHVVDVTDEHISFDYNPGTDASIIGQPIEVELEIMLKIGEGGTVAAPGAG